MTVLVVRSDASSHHTSECSSALHNDEIWKKTTICGASQSGSAFHMSVYNTKDAASVCANLP